MLRQLTLLDVALKDQHTKHLDGSNTWYMQLADAPNTRQLRGETRPDLNKALKSSGKPSYLVSDLLATFPRPVAAGKAIPVPQV